uniref:Putative UDP-glucosyl transferase 85A2 n=1 Tax=Davidia involucrata TaxID=16924 RepID=A0A5B7A6P5_DAVIN
MERGVTPFKDVSYLTNGYLDTTVDWIPGMKNMRMRDIPSFIRTTDPNDIMLNFTKGEIEGCKRASAIILHTFEALEHDVLQALSSMFPPIYTIGPLQLLLDQISNKSTTLMFDECSLWKQEAECIEWLTSNEPNSVLYVNFGSIMVLTPHQLVELAWGLANSKQNFLWIVWPDVIMSDYASLPPEFIPETKGRGLMASWCPQEQVLNHPSVGWFLTHNGWNSTIESITSGVLPMLCFPFFAEQQTNCRYASSEWGIGMEIDSNYVKRDEVEKLVRELMEGETKGKEMKNKAMEWKTKAQEATSPGGSSYLNFERLLKEILLSKN